LAALIEENEASAEVTTVYADIKATRGVDWINNFWKVIANDLAPLKRMWGNVKQVMAPGALDPLTKELVYIAVSITNNCPYCIASHTASARGKGMTDEQFAELLAVIGLANETNRVAIGYGVPIDDRFQRP
jgi:AhpD family alkylhydroperoxidase